MATTTRMATRFRLPARIRNKRKSSGDFSARLGLIDLIAELPGIETVEQNDAAGPRRVEIYLRRDAPDRVLNRGGAELLCRLDRNGLIVSGLSLWERHQVLTNGWGRLTDDQVCIHLPRDLAELDIVWSIVRRAYDRLPHPATAGAGSPVVSTWDWPKFSRTSLQ